MAPPLRLPCDEMLKGIGRWLRAAGYDTAIAVEGGADDDLVRIVQAEVRVLLTCDRRLAARCQQSERVVRLNTESLDAAARELRERLGIDWLHAPFTRCLVDNAALQPAAAAERARLPSSAKDGPGPFKVCPECGGAYWPGSHVRRMLARLEGWQTEQADTWKPIGEASLRARCGSGAAVEGAGLGRSKDRRTRRHRLGLVTAPASPKGDNGGSPPY